MFCRGVARRLDRSSHLHRLRYVAVERRCFSPGCQQRVAGDLAGGVGHRSVTKRRLERLGDRPGRRVCRQSRQPPRKRPRNRGPGSVQACDIGMRVVAFESRGARTEYICCRRHRLRVLVSGELDHGSFGRRRQKGEEPVQLVWERRQRGCRTGRPGGSVLASQSAPAESVDGLGRRWCTLCNLVPVGVQEVRDRAQSLRCLALEIDAPARWPEEQDGADPSSDCETPTSEAVRNR